MKTHNNGFSIAELLVVMVMIGILSAIGVGTYQDIQSTSRDAVRMQTINQLAKAIEAEEVEFTGPRDYWYDGYESCTGLGIPNDWSECVYPYTGGPNQSGTGCDCRGVNQSRVGAPALRFLKPVIDNTQISVPSVAENIEDECFVYHHFQSVGVDDFNIFTYDKNKDLMWSSNHYDFFANTLGIDPQDAGIPLNTCGDIQVMMVQLGMGHPGIVIPPNQ